MKTKDSLYSDFLSGTLKQRELDLPPVPPHNQIPQNPTQQPDTTTKPIRLPAKVEKLELTMHDLITTRQCSLVSYHNQKYKIIIDEDLFGEFENEKSLEKRLAEILLNTHNKFSKNPTTDHIESTINTTNKNTIGYFQKQCYHNGINIVEPKYSIGLKPKDIDIIFSNKDDILQLSKQEQSSSINIIDSKTDAKTKNRAHVTVGSYLRRMINSKKESKKPIVQNIPIDSEEISMKYSINSTSKTSEDDDSIGTDENESVQESSNIDNIQKDYEYAQKQAKQALDRVSRLEEIIYNANDPLNLSSKKYRTDIEPEKIQKALDELDKIDPKYKSNTEDALARSYIESRPDLKNYRDIIKKSFNEAFLVASAIATKQIKIETSSIFSSLFSITSILSDGTPFVPAVLSLAKVVVDKTTLTKKGGKYAFISDLNPTSNPIDAAIFSERLANTLTICREEEINSLSPRSKTSRLPQSLKALHDSMNKFFKDNISKLDKSMARGMFSDDLSETQLLSYSDAKKALEFVCSGELCEILQSKKPSANPDPLLELIKEIAKAVTELEEIKTLAPESMTINIQSADSKISSKTTQNQVPTNILEELKLATESRKKLLDLQEPENTTHTSSEIPQKTIDGLTRKDIEEIVKQATGGLTLEVINFINQKFEEDQIRSQRTKAQVENSNKNVIEEISELLEGQISENNVIPSTILSKRDRRINSPSTIKAITSVSSLQKESDIDSLKKENEEMRNRLSHIEKTVRQQNNENKGGCCVVS